MEIGDIVFHVDYPNERLRIKRISETIATVERIDQEDVFLPKGKMPPVWICQLKNLRTKD